MTTTRLYRVIHPVPDIERAVGFYADLFQMPGVRVSEGRHYFNLGGTVLAVYDPVADGDQPTKWRHHPNQYVYIGVQNLEAALKRARRAGATILGAGIESMPWGERLFYANDPFGNPVCMVDNATLFWGDRNPGE